MTIRTREWWPACRSGTFLQGSVRTPYLLQIGHPADRARTISLSADGPICRRSGTLAAYWQHSAVLPEGFDRLNTSGREAGQNSLWLACRQADLIVRALARCQRVLGVGLG